ncbi:hypothetical protein NIES23_05260 [Trichormus variabilis NIES-23]|uniref:Uncharacterized protein n=1 Tax=Trichormus variabilis NIES-23 TaxID=1973479 RepID=A0A1Z4KFJ4_ANAVA|nr:hypothetical protein NIES23_05260 [Trichormus variabilis NIES-23]
MLGEVVYTPDGEAVAWAEMMRSSDKPFHVYANQTMVHSKQDISISQPFKGNSSIRWEFGCKIPFLGLFWSYILSYLGAFLLQSDN